MKPFQLETKLQMLRSRWAALSASEQRTLKIGALVMLPLLFYGVLWQPAHDNVSRLSQSVPQLRAQLVQMQAQAVEVQTLRHGAQPAVLEGEVLKHVVEGAIAAAGWGAPAVTIEPSEKNEVRVNADSIEFARWVVFLRELENTHHLRVGALTLAASTTPGMVKVNAVIGNGAEQ